MTKVLPEITTTSWSGDVFAEWWLGLTSVNRNALAYTIVVGICVAA
jgi:hypothetical protein